MKTAEELEAEWTMQLIDAQNYVKRMRILDEVHERNDSGGHRNGFCAACGELGMALTTCDMIRKPTMKQAVTPVTEDRYCRMPTPHPSHHHRYIYDDTISGGRTQGSYYCRGDKQRGT